MLPITALYAGLLTLVFITLSARVILYRRAHRVSLGDSGDKALLKRMRAQANCAEYAPMALILLALVEMQGAPARALHLLGLMLLTGRMMHAVGFSRHPQIMGLRVGGMGLTLSMMLLAALGLIAHAIL